MIDRRSDGAAVHEFIGQDTGYQCERSFVGDVGERRPDQIDLAHALGLDRVGPLLVGRLHRTGLETRHPPRSLRQRDHRGHREVDIGGKGHEVVSVGRKSGDYQADISDPMSLKAFFSSLGSFDADNDRSHDRLHAKKLQ
jgi:hypothetical protein